MNFKRPFRIGLTANKILPQRITSCIISPLLFLLVFFSCSQKPNYREYSRLLSFVQTKDTDSSQALLTGKVLGLNPEMLSKDSIYIPIRTYLTIMDSNHVEKQVIIDSTGNFSVYLPNKTYELTFNDETSQVLVVENFKAKPNTSFKIEVLLAKENDSTFNIAAKVTLPVTKTGQPTFDHH